MKFRFPVVIAVLFGVLTLPGYFLPIQIAKDAQVFFLRLAVYLSSLALLVGVINLSRVHLTKTITGKPGGAYSLVLFISLCATFLFVFYFGFQHSVTVFIVRYMQIPLEASLAALIVFVLLVGGARLLYRRRDVTSFLFLGTAILVLLAAIPLPRLPSEVLKPIEDLRGGIASILMVLAGGGGRGILLGMALGAAATGLRVLMGVDRPYDR